MARSAASTSPRRAFFLTGLRALYDALEAELRAADPVTAARTAQAVALKACFLKLAQERHLLSAEPVSLFRELMRFSHRPARPRAQGELFGRPQVAESLDDLLAELHPAPVRLSHATLAPWYDFLFSQRLDDLDPDLLGAVYQQLESREARSVKGQFFTPAPVIAALLDTLPLDLARTPALRLLDPACGSGSFLLAAYDRLKPVLIAQGLSADEAHIRIVGEHLFGFDLDPFAVTLTRMNLMLKARVSRPLAFHIYALNPLTRDDEAWISPTETTRGAFHAVVGNPPWGSRLSEAERRYAKGAYAAAQSGLNAFTLFLERAQEWMAEGGRTAFLIPEAFLNIKAHRSAREGLLDHCAVERLALCGELFPGVFAPALMLTCRRESDAARREAAPVTILEQPRRGPARECVIPQHELAPGPERIFAIHAEAEGGALLAKIAHNTATLKGHARFHMGIVTGDNARLIAQGTPTPNHEPLLVGKDIEPFRIHSSGHTLVFDPDTLQQAAPLAAYRAPLKLVYRFIGKRLIFALDDAQRLTLNNVNFVIPALPGFSPLYLLALLNSSVLQYVYAQTFFTLKVLRGNLERLPLRYADDPTQQRLAGWVREAATASEARYDELCTLLDEAVANIYGLTDEERAWVHRTVGEADAPRRERVFHGSEAGLTLE